MDVFSLQTFSFLGMVMFIITISMHLFKKNAPVTVLYAAQSCIVSIVLLLSAIEGSSYLPIAVAGVTFFVKVLVAPAFFLRLIKRHQLRFAVSSYLNMPLTLAVIALLTAVPFSTSFKPLGALAPDHAQTLYLAMAMMFVSVFMIINRKGALSQMVGVLSLENSIVLFASAAGLESSVGPQVGILFDITIWVLIATVFGSMMYKHFGSLNVAEMNSLKEE